MRVAIGMFAYNEAANIASAIADVTSQRFPDSWSVRVLVLCNGCTDDTYDVARTEAQRYASIDVQAVELVQGGKSRTWNWFVENQAEANDVLVFVDGDIRITDSDVVPRLVQHVEGGSKAAVSRAVATFPVGASPLLKAIFERTKSGHRNGAIVGSLYAARSEVVRDVRLPNPCLVEDGFLAATLVSGVFSHPDRNDDVVAAPHVSHTYEAPPTLKAFFRHSIRLELGTEMNAALFGALWALPDVSSRLRLMREFAEGRGLEEAYTSYQNRPDTDGLSGRRVVRRFVQDTRDVLSDSKVHAPLRIAKQFYLAAARARALELFRERTFVW